MGMAWSVDWNDAWDTVAEENTPSKDLYFYKYNAFETILKGYENIFLSKIEFEFTLPPDMTMPFAI
jgi:hypothetical protein